MCINEPTRKQILTQLEGYREKQRQIAILAYQQLYEPGLTQEEIIEGMALSSSLDSVKGGGVSDRTMSIALGYRSRAARLNRERRQGIVKELERLKQEVKELEFYVSLLESRQAEVIRAHYFQGTPWAALAEQFQVSTRTVSRWCDAGVDRLLEFYQLAGAGKER